MGTAAPTRRDLADLIVERVTGEQEQAAKRFASSGPIRHTLIDDLLPDELATRLHDAFPRREAMVLKRSLREDKYVGAQMDQYEPILEEATYAFQDDRVVTLVGAITGLPELFPDINLYAGGISSMETDQFLNPHVDNSHDMERQQWRVLNLLYYVTPNWTGDDGGSLELWPDGPRGEAIVIESRFNRLVLMETHGRSWHSVSRVTARVPRRCLSNYYFSPISVRLEDRYHVTSFRGRPGESMRDLALRADSAARWTVRKLVGTKLIHNPHVYKRDG